MRYSSCTFLFFFSRMQLFKSFPVELNILSVENLCTRVPRDRNLYFTVTQSSQFFHPKYSLCFFSLLVNIFFLSLLFLRFVLFSSRRTVYSVVYNEPISLINTFSNANIFLFLFGLCACSRV